MSSETGPLRATGEQPVDAGEGGSVTLPVIEEQLVVGKRRVQRGRIRVTKRVRHVERLIDRPGFEEDVEVERVPVNRVVDGPPPVRYEGDTMIVPLLKEVLVVQKRLVLKEELRITRRRREVREPQRVTLRSEDVRVERIEGAETEEGADTPA